MQFFHRVRFSSVMIDLLLKGTTNSIIDWIKITAVWGSRVRLDGVNVLFSDSQLCRIRTRAAEVSICDDGILLGCQTTGPFLGRLDSSSLVEGAVDLRASTD